MYIYVLSNRRSFRRPSHLQLGMVASNNFMLIIMYSPCLDGVVVRLMRVIGDVIGRQQNAPMNALCKVPV
jgi:hypothetical protein